MFSQFFVMRDALLVGLDFSSHNAYFLTLVVITLWQIWKARNHYLFYKVALNPLFTSRQISLQCQQFQQSDVFADSFPFSSPSLEFYSVTAGSSPFPEIVALHCDVSWKDQLTLAVIVVTATSSTDMVMHGFTQRTSIYRLVLVRLQLFLRQLSGPLMLASIYQFFCCSYSFYSIQFLKSHILSHSMHS